MHKMRKRRRAPSNVMEVVMLTRLLGGSCLQPTLPAVVQQRQLRQLRQQPSVSNGSNRGWWCTGGRLNRSQLSFTTTASDTPPYRETATSFQGFVQGSPRPNLPYRQLTTSACSTKDVSTHGADQDEVWAGERNGSPAAGVGEAAVGSSEFVDLVKAQFDVLVSVLGVDRVVLHVRRENTETGDEVADTCGLLE